MKDINGGSVVQFIEEPEYTIQDSLRDECKIYGHIWSESMPQYCERCGVAKGDVR